MFDSRERASARSCQRVMGGGKELSLCSTLQNIAALNHRHQDFNSLQTDQEFGAF